MAQTEKLTHKDVRDLVKHDAFRETTVETLKFVSGHKSQLYKYVGGALALIVLIGGVFWFRGYQHTVREEKLEKLLHIWDAPVTTDPPPFAARSFKTQPEKDKTLETDFAAFASDNKGSDEAVQALYYLGVHYADAGNLSEADKNFRAAIDQGSGSYAAMAKIALAQSLRAQGKVDEGAKLIQSIIDKPVDLVSKEAATIELARLIMQTKPVEARRLLEPLRTSRAAISQAAVALLSEMK